MEIIWCNIIMTVLWLIFGIILCFNDKLAGKYNSEWIIISFVSCAVYISNSLKWL